MSGIFSTTSGALRRTADRQTTYSRPLSRCECQHTKDKRIQLVFVKNYPNHERNNRNISETSNSRVSSRSEKPRNRLRSPIRVDKHNPRHRVPTTRHKEYTSRRPLSGKPILAKKRLLRARGRQERAMAMAVEEGMPWPGCWTVCSELNARSGNVSRKDVVHCLQFHVVCYSVSSSTHSAACWVAILRQLSCSHALLPYNANYGFCLVMNSNVHILIPHKVDCGNLKHDFQIC